MVRYRCHAAIAMGKVTAPALVEIDTGSGYTTVSPYEMEVHSTRHYDGIIVIAPPGASPSLPSSVSRATLRATLAHLLHLTNLPDATQSYFIPLG